MNPPGHLKAVCDAVDAAVPGLEHRVYSGRPMLGTRLPYAAVSDPASAAAHHSNRTAHFSGQIEVSVFAESSEEASALESAVIWGNLGPAIGNGLAEGWSLITWTYSGSASLVESEASPGARAVYRRALTFRLMLLALGTIR